jgi:hypothetical protein
VSKMQRKEVPENASGGWGLPRELSGRRSRGSRSHRPLVLIIVEGVKTEKQYFESLAREERASAVHVDVIHSKGDTAPENLVQQADKARKSRIENDKWEDDGQVWCVCDTEQPDLSISLRNALVMAQKNNIKMAVSNPAFEFWYLLHFRETDAPCSNGRDMKKKLRHYIDNYTETMEVYTLLRLLTDKALQRASDLRIRSNGAWDNFINPSTGVDQLVRVVVEFTARRSRN